MQHAFNPKLTPFRALPGIHISPESLVEFEVFDERNNSTDKYQTVDFVDLYTFMRGRYRIDKSIAKFTYDDKERLVRCIAGKQYYEMTYKTKEDVS